MTRQRGAQMELLIEQISVVTGAGSGIGRAIAAGYARAGAYVVTVDRDADAAAETARSISAGGGRANSYRLDVTDMDACRAVAKSVAETVGAISILVNNAGITRRNGITGPAEAVLQDWQDVIAVNLTGTFNVTHAFLDQLRANKGRIVNIGSIQSLLHLRTPSSPAYTASKHGVLGLTRALAAELGKDGVRVNAIGPGFIATPLNADTRSSKPELVQTFVDHTPLGRAGHKSSQFYSEWRASQYSSANRRHRSTRIAALLRSMGVLFPERPKHIVDAVFLAAGDRTGSRRFGF
jgi:3-oxoacyl-[acyl-carrier protein] reductase